MPEQNARSALRWLWLAVLVVILDQASKLWAEAVLQHGQIELLSWFNFTLAYNAARRSVFWPKPAAGSVSSFSA